MKKFFKQITSWFFRILSTKCPECGAPMVIKKYQTTIKGECFPVLHCIGCNHEYILK
ncbi:hypothetical protein [Parabacteroides goldsteinii]